MHFESRQVNRSLQKRARGRARARTHTHTHTHTRLLSQLAHARTHGHAHASKPPCIDTNAYYIDTLFGSISIAFWHAVCVCLCARACAFRFFGRGSALWTINRFTYNYLYIYIMYIMYIYIYIYIYWYICRRSALWSIIPIHGTAFNYIYIYISYNKIYVLIFLPPQRAVDHQPDPGLHRHVGRPPVAGRDHRFLIDYK